MLFDVFISTNEMYLELFSFNEKCKFPRYMKKNCAILYALMYIFRRND